MRSEDSDAKASLSPENRGTFRHSLLRTKPHSGVVLLPLSLRVCSLRCPLPTTPSRSPGFRHRFNRVRIPQTPFVFTKVHIYKQPIIMWVASAATCKPRWFRRVQTISSTTSSSASSGISRHLRGRQRHHVGCLGRSFRAIRK